MDSRTIESSAPPERAFVPIRRIGGVNGWYYANWLWRLRGILDEWTGGPGLRRGRRHPDQIAVGDHLDWWRVEAFVPDRLLRLNAELRLPGEAWLEFEVTPSPTGSLLRQTAAYNPRGILGRAYWYATWPLHKVLFAHMLKRIAARAESRNGIE